MTELNKKILNLIINNYSMKDICNNLNISQKQLYLRIKQLLNCGYLLEPSYTYNSDVYYTLKKDRSYMDTNKVSIKMSEEDNIFRCIVFSDLHIGSEDADIKLVNIAYEYAAKNNISVLLNCGDSIEGDYTSVSKNIKDINSQLEYFIKKYPYDKNINNFMIFGNHDHYSLHKNGLDISKAIKNSRYDIIPIGFGQGNVNVKNDSIILFHKLRDGYKPTIKDEKVVLAGHGHMMKTKLRDIFWIGVPTLSYKSNYKTKDVIPGFIDLIIDIENNKFEYATARHMIITPKVVQVSEVRGKVKNLFNDNRRK